MLRIDRNTSPTHFTAITSASIIVGAQIASSSTADTFDMNRFSTAGAGAFETFHVDETQLLQQVLDSETVSDETMLLVTSTADGYLALMRDQMAYHHIAQGIANGLEWMAKF